METTTKTRNAYQLANLADCVSPDSNGSPGADFLLGVQSDVIYQLEDVDPSTVDVYDLAHEIADSAADLIYTRTIWETFLDLGAYQEYDELVSEYGAETVANPGGQYSGMEGTAVLCLYQIAYRLATVLLEEAIENQDDDDETDE